MEIAITVLISGVTAIVTTNVIAAHQFDVIDRYVKDVIELTKKYMKDVADQADKWK